MIMIILLLNATNFMHTVFLTTLIIINLVNIITFNTLYDIFFDISNRT
jgi:hypothetical protein